LRARLRDPQN